MKKIISTVFIILITLNLQAQSKSKEDKKEETVTFKIDSSLVTTLDSTIKTLYSVISGEKDEKRNWKFMKYLFHKDAKLIPSGKNKAGDFKVRYMTPNDYIKESGKWLEENGFFEKEIHRKTEVFGNIAHVFSTYEAFYSKLDKNPFMRGINSIQLLNDGERWWILNVYWTQESEYNPIPKKYL